MMRWSHRNLMLKGIHLRRYIILKCWLLCKLIQTSHYSRYIILAYWFDLNKSLYIRHCEQNENECKY